VVGYRFGLAFGFSSSREPRPYGSRRTSLQIKELMRYWIALDPDNYSAIQRLANGEFKDKGRLAGGHVWIKVNKRIWKRLTKIKKTRHTMNAVIMALLSCRRR